MKAVNRVLRATYIVFWQVWPVVEQGASLSWGLGYNKWGGGGQEGMACGTHRKHGEVVKGGCSWLCCRTRYKPEGLRLLGEQREQSGNFLSNRDE